MTDQATAAAKRKRATKAKKTERKTKAVRRKRTVDKKKAAREIEVAVSTAKKKSRAVSRGKLLPSKGGRKPFAPTEEQREHVLILVGLGLRQEEIVLLVKNPTTGKPITEKTLALHFPYELEAGVAFVKSDVGSSIVKRARDLSHPQGATCAIFYAKTRMGWKERQVVEVESKSGVLVPPPSVTPEEWIAAATAEGKKKSEPGTEAE